MTMWKSAIAMTAFIVFEVSVEIKRIKIDYFVEN